MKNAATSSIVFATLFSFTSYSQNNADDIVGIWVTSGKEPAKIQIYRSGEKYYGKVIWLESPAANGKPRVDGNNPVKAKRSSPVVGLVILTGFTFNGKDEWRGGDIYDPESGKTYSSYMYLKNRNTLKVRGFLGMALFGRTETWTRAN